MQNMRTVVLAGIAALALAGTAYAAAQRPVLHTMTVKTPDGGVATIEYSGNVAPKVTFGTVPMQASFFGAASPFADIDRISAAMNREMGALLRQANMLAVPFATANPLYNATLNGAPARNARSWFARAGASGFCMRSVEITRNGTSKPKIVSHSTGNCGGSSGLAGTTEHAIPRNGHGMLEAVGKAPANHKLPLFYEAGYTPH